MGDKAREREKGGKGARRRKGGRRTGSALDECITRPPDADCTVRAAGKNRSKLNAKFCVEG